MYTISRECPAHIIIMQPCGPSNSQLRDTPTGLFLKVPETRNLNYATLANATDKTDATSGAFSLDSRNTSILGKFSKTQQTRYLKRCAECLNVDKEICFRRHLTDWGSALSDTLESSISMYINNLYTQTNGQCHTEPQKLSRLSALALRL